MYKDLIKHPDYYNRHEKLPNVEHIPTIAGRDMQAAEQNELQCVFDDKIKALGYALYIDGAIIDGCEITLDRNMKTAHLGGGRVFIAGHVRAVASVTLSIPGDHDVQIGIWKKSRVLTENEDQNLLNPAIGTPGYRQPGAYRIISTAEWGLNLDNLSMPFYPIYTISGGEIVTQVIREKNQDYLDALARYDRDSHANYVVDGLRVIAVANVNAEDDRKKQSYSISQGLAHIQGYEARLTHSVRLVVDEEANLYEVISEVHQFDGSAGGSVISVHQTPIESIKSVRVTKEKTVDLSHGNYTGCSDPLPDTSVIKIISVRQGAHVFASNVYRLDANKVNWEVDGDEPAPGSMFQVTYHYRTNVTPDTSDYTSLTLSEIVDGSLIEIDYSYRMPRKDIIVMYRDRSVTLVKGIPHRYAPTLPSTPPGAICLATVEQTWTGLPIVKNVAVQAVRMDTLTEMRRQIQDLYSLTSMERLKMDALVSAPSSAFGVFVDPLLDDDLRDKGTPQTATIAGQELQLPLDLDVLFLPHPRKLTLDYRTDVLIEQPMHTKTMKINPYLAFDPLPARVTLEPSIDRWTETQYGVGDTIENAGGTLRQLDIKIIAEGFGPNEVITILFDEIGVACATKKSDANGRFEGTIKIPPNVPTGSKAVVLQSAHTVGIGTFIGIKTIQYVSSSATETGYQWKDFNEWPQSLKDFYIDRNGEGICQAERCHDRGYNDPLAETFILHDTRHVAGVDFWVGVRGTSPVRVDIREVQVGYPTPNVLTSCTIPASQLNSGTFCRAMFNEPVLLRAGVEYAIVLLAETADHEVGIVEIGDWDPEAGWVQSQQYGGVLLSSANAHTWTSHPGADLTFRLLGAVFDAERPMKIELSEHDLTGVTDLLPMAEYIRTAAETDITFVFEKDGVEVIRAQSGQHLRLADAVTGRHKVSLEYYGSRHYSPIFGREPQLIIGEIRLTGDYISRAFRCGVNRRVMVTIDAISPGTSAIDVYVLTDEAVWTKAVLDESDPIGDNWFRQFYYVPCGRSETRIKIVLTGDAASRPRVKNVRGVILGA